jgi:DNA ligase 1
MLFSEVAQYFEQISKQSSRIEITKLLAQLYKQADACEARIISNLALGTLRPAHEGVKFNYAEKNIIKALAQLLQLDTAELTKQIKSIGDIGLFMRSHAWHEVNKPITVIEVFDALCELETVSGTGSQEEKTRLLIQLLTQLDALSASYVISIIIGTMRLGFSDMTIIDSLSWMIRSDKSLHAEIERAYNLCADIGLIAEKIKACGIEILADAKPLVGIPIRPAAAERLANAQEIVEKLGPCVAQPKLDGFRLQIHVKKNQDKSEIWFFSRNLQDMSYMFPDLYHAFEQFKVDSLIVEGEAIVYDEDTGQFLPFQETVKRKRKHNIEEIAESLPLQLFLFDILYLNGQPLLDLPHTQRRKILEQVIAENSKTSTIQVIEEKSTPTTQALEAYFNEQITKGLEGLVVKRPDTLYQPG